MRVKLGSAYPASPAEVEIVSSVGLSDADVGQLREALGAAGREMAGECCLFNLLQTAKDFVNDRNTPSDDCCICLCEFEQDDQFFKTSCGHCFHVPCIATWIYDQHAQALERNQKDENAAHPAAPSADAEEDGEDEKNRKDGECESARDEGDVELECACCPICRSEIGTERIALLQTELRRLQAAHHRETALKEARQAAEDAAKAAELEARKIEERLLRERREQVCVCVCVCMCVVGMVYV